MDSSEIKTVNVHDPGYSFLDYLAGSSKDGVSFMSGWPSPKEMEEARHILLKATQETLGSSKDCDKILNYGPEQGCETFIKELACFLSEQYRRNVHETNLMVSAGSTQGLQLALTCLCDHPPIVFVEDPTYFVALTVLQRDFQSNVVPVSSSESGIDLDMLEKQLIAHKPQTHSGSNKERFWAVIYLVSVFNNPVGIVYSPDKCQQLLCLARKHNVLLITDDVYNLLWYSTSDTVLAEPPEQLIAFDNPNDADYAGGHVVSLGSFSKILSPGLRVGWLETSSSIVTKLCESGMALSGGCFNHYSSQLVSSALQSGLITQHLISVRAVYGERLKVMCDTLDKHLPSEVKFLRPKGGYFVWLVFPSKVDTVEFVRFTAERYGIVFIPGVYFSPSGGSRNCARLSFSRNNTETIESGIKELCMAYKDYCLMG